MLLHYNKNYALGWAAVLFGTSVLFSALSHEYEMSTFRFMLLYCRVPFSFSVSTVLTGQTQNIDGRIMLCVGGVYTLCVRTQQERAALASLRAYLHYVCDSTV